MQRQPGLASRHAICFGLLGLLALAFVSAAFVLGLLLLYDYEFGTYALDAPLYCWAALALSWAVFLCAAAAAYAPPPTQRLLGGAVAAFALAALALAIACLADPDFILIPMRRLWREPIGGEDADAVAGLEAKFHCCGWSERRAECAGKAPEICGEVIPPPFQRRWRLAAGFLLAGGIAVCSAVIVGYVVSCRNSENYERNERMMVSQTYTVESWD